MILIHSALPNDTRTVVNSAEAEFTNMDLKSISVRSFSDPHTRRKSSHLLCPEFLQTATAVEYSHTPAIPDDVIPGTKGKLVHR